MPKLKTRKSVQKRIVNVSKGGKLMRRSTSAQHRTTGKTKRTLRQSKMKIAIGANDVKQIKKMLPYS